MLAGVTDLPLIAGSTEHAALETSQVSEAEIASDDSDFVGDGSGGDAGIQFPRFFFDSDFAEGEGSTSGGGGGGPCSEPTLEASNGTTNEGDTFNLSVSGSISGGCSLTGYDIDWGDGSSGYYSALDPLSHTYVDDDPTATPADNYTVDVVGYWNDSSSASASGTVTVSNLAPTAADDEGETDEDTPITISVLANDTDPGINDSFEIVEIVGGFGTVTDTGNGILLYDPGAFAILADGETAVDSFTYVMVDDDDAQAFTTGTVTITVMGVSDPPVAADDSLTVEPCSSLVVAAPGVLGNDDDPDSPTLTTALVTGPSHGTLEFNSDGSFIYTPDSGFHGDDSFTYSTSDDSDSSTATVTLAVAECNAFVVISSDGETTEPETEEELSFVTFTITLIDGGGPTTVSWDTLLEEDDTATPEDDFGSDGGSVELSPENPSQTIQIPVFHDTEPEDDETFHVLLMGASNNVTVLAQASKAAGKIQNQGTGRKVTSLSSANITWEGDTATFTATLSSPTPTPPESFTWEKRSLNSKGRYDGQAWTALDTGFGTAGAVIQSKFDEPFNGEVRVTLVSGTTKSSATIPVRAKAAFPINFGKTAAGVREGDHLQVTYTWASSSGRVADLDGVEGGEFVWYTNNGLKRWNNPNANVPDFIYHHIPFAFAPLWKNRFWQVDGEYKMIDWTDLVTPTTDDHGAGVPVWTEAFGKETANQYYWYKITDGAFGDSKDKNILATHTITYWVFQQGGVWQYKIDKPGEGTIQFALPALPFVAR